MTQSKPFGAFAGLLEDLKRRSGLSYEAIGRKANLARSSVHRYCSGSSLPQDFGTAERIAKICGASREELADLHRSWSRADSVRDQELPATKSAEPSPPETPPPVMSPASDDRPGPAAGATWRQAIRPRRPSMIIGAALTAGVLAAAMVAAFGDEDPRPPARVRTPQQISGPTWSQAPKPIPRELLGVTINSSTGSMPTFQVGAVRFWDSRTRWANIQPQRDVFDFSILDRLVKGAESINTRATFTIGGAPEWASPDGARTAYDDGSRASPPKDLKVWDTFVRTIANRYKGRIQAYELWDYVNHLRFYNGSMETLVEMTRRAASIIKGIDRKAIIVCPSMDRLWIPKEQRFLERFARLGGYDQCDAAGIKMQQGRAADPPELMANMSIEVDKAFHRAGLHLPLWNTGPSYESVLEKQLDEETAANHAVRFFLAGIYGRIERMYFYNWGSIRVPIVLQAAGGSPTLAAQFVEELNRWLRRAKVRSCGNGPSAGLPARVWQCQFTSPEKKDLRIVWTTSGTARMSAPKQAKSMQFLDGSTKPIAYGDAVEITPRPILVQAG